MTVKGPSSPDDHLDALTKTMAHPLRVRLFAALVERPGVSIREIAAHIDEPERRVRYHLEAMGREGLTEVTRREIRRGGVEYFYGAKVRPLVEEADLDEIDFERQRQMALQILRLVFADATAAFRAKQFGASRGHGEVRHWGELDDVGWEELSAVHRRAVDEVDGVFKRARERLDSRGEEGTSATSATFYFETASWFPRSKDP
jgi:DNA-binding transcriptional ArsR family regulator